MSQKEISDLGQMIREYDALHSALLSAAAEDGRASAKGLCPEEEEFLLNKISSLETEKNEKVEMLRRLEKNNAELQSRLESRARLQKTREAERAALAAAEAKKLERLSEECAGLRERLEERRAAAEKLRAENERAFEALREMEVAQSQLRLETSQEFEKSTLKTDRLEKMLTRQRALTCHVQSGLGEKAREASQLAAKVAEAERRNAALLQLNKSLETHAGALEGEKVALGAKLERLERAFAKMKDGFQTVAVELRRGNTDEARVEETLREFFDIREISPLCGESSTGEGGAEERKAARSIEALEREFREGDFPLGPEKIASVELELDAASQRDCSELDKQAACSRTLNNSDSLKQRDISSSQTQRIGAIDAVFGEAPRARPLAKLSRRELELKIEEQIDSHIQRRSLKGKRAFRFGPEERLFDSGKTVPKMGEARSTLVELKAGARSMLFAAAALSAQEKGEMQGALEACDSVRECFSRAFEMLLEKLNARGLGAQALEDKRGRRRALEAALETKREELARLQQTFIERNSQYEELLNETLEVNSQLRRQKRRRRKGDKATPKSAKPQKEKEKSSGLFSFIKESFMPGASERSAEKPGAGRQSGKSRPSFVISKAFAREHSQARFEAPGRQAEPSPHKNLRFVEEMGNIDQDLGPEPIFAYNAELSSVRDLWRRSQARRSATLKGFLKAASPGKGEAGAAEGEAGEAAPSLEGILQKRQIEISKRKKNQFFFFKKLNQMFG